MGCSAVTLSVGTVGAVVAVACLAIAFGTDNWYEIRVDRARVRQALEGNLDALREIEGDIRYFSRDEGLFRTCFPEQKPRGLKVYISPVQTECVNINYYLPEDEISDTFSEQRWERLHMARSVIAIFFITFLFFFIGFFTGVAGCWKRSRSNILATGLVLILAALSSATSMGLWHGVQYYDYYKLRDEAAFHGWPAILRKEEVTTFNFGWSYMLAWCGVGMSLITAVLFLCAARCVRREKKAEQTKNMQYLMPVYPDKRQPYAYGYAYPGPYYTAGGGGGGYGPSYNY